MSRLPNLPKICFWGPKIPEAAAIINNFFQLTTEDSALEVQKSCLSPLKTVELQHDDTEMGVDLDIILLFAALPSVGTLCSHMLTGTIN